MESNDGRRFDGVCVDSDTTRYPEDCFRIERVEGGWILEVAVPDVAGRLTTDEPQDGGFLDQLNADVPYSQRAIKPEGLSFAPGVERPCVIIKTSVSDDGEIALLGVERAIHTGNCTTRSTIASGRAGPHAQNMYLEARRMSETFRGTALNPDDVVACVNVVTGCAVGEHFRERKDDGAFMKRVSIRDMGKTMCTFFDIVEGEHPDRLMPIAGKAYVQITSPLRRYQDLHNLRVLLELPHRDLDDLSIANTMNDFERQHKTKSEMLEKFAATKDPRCAFFALAADTRCGKIGKESAAAMGEIILEKDAAIRAIPVLKQLIHHFPACAVDLEQILTKAREHATKKIEPQPLTQPVLNPSTYNEYNKSRAYAGWKKYSEEGHNPKDILPLYTAVVYGSKAGVVENEWLERVVENAKPMDALEKIEPLLKFPLLRNVRTMVEEAIENLKFRVPAPEEHWQKYESQGGGEKSPVSNAFRALEACAIKNIVPPQEWFDQMEKNHSPATLEKIATERLARKENKSEYDDGPVQHTLRAYAKRWSKMHDEQIKHEIENDGNLATEKVAQIIYTR